MSKRNYDDGIYLSNQAIKIVYSYHNRCGHERQISGNRIIYIRPTTVRRSRIILLPAHKEILVEAA